jgi:hypothetical protein
MRAGTARTLFTTVLAFCLLGASVPAADAAFHIMKVREVHGAPDAAANTSYLELQMYANGQNVLDGHLVSVYDEDGGPAAATCTLPAGLGATLSGQDQRTVLIGETDHLAADATCSALDRIHAGDLGGAGAVCFNDATPPDCVSWGGTSFTTTIPDSAVPFSEALPAGMALKRDTSGGSCATALDAGDDTDNVQNDFDVVTPDPTLNSTAPVETLCSPPPGGGGSTTNPGTTATPPKKCKKGQKLVKGKCRKKKRKRKK